MLLYNLGIFMNDESDDDVVIFQNDSGAKMFLPDLNRGIEKTANVGILLSKYQLKEVANRLLELSAEFDSKD